MSVTASRTGRIGVAVSLHLFRFSLVLPATVLPALVVGSELLDNFVVGGFVSATTLVVTTAAFLYATGRGRSYVDAGPVGLRPVAVGLLCGGGLVAAQQLLSAAATAVGAPVASAQYSTGSLLQLVGIVVATVVVVPAAEELFYRNLLQKYLAGVVAPAAAVGVASVAFASAHTLNFLGQPLPAIAVGVLVVTVQGVLLGTIYHYTENLVVTVLAHALNNVAALAVAA